MRKRHLKKMATHQSKRELGNDYRQAHSRGSKKLRRRSKAFRRLSRQMRRRSLHRYAAAQELLPQLLACKPVNEIEAASLQRLLTKVRSTIYGYQTSARMQRVVSDASKAFSGLSKAVDKAAKSGSWQPLKEHLETAVAVLGQQQ